MKKIAIATLGCKVNQFESASFITDFREAGCEIVPFSSSADTYVINTCAVTGRAGQQSRQMIRQAMRNNPDARLIVTGCYAQMAGDELLDIVENPVCIVGNGNKHLLVETALSENQCDLVMLMGEIGRKKEICPLTVRRFSGRTRAFLRIQDGCNNFCSYCIVPYTRGRSRSLPLAGVLQQAEIFQEEGYREIVITGINVGKYGLDLDERHTIYTLLDRLCREFPDVRLRLSSVEPVEVNDVLLGLLTTYQNFMPHLHIPLQSGDDQILSLMNRRYTAEIFIDIIRKIQRVLPSAAIGCDVLGGFPGESDQAAENTWQLLAGLPISYLHVFPYAKRPGTLAASFQQQVPKKVKEERVRRLRALDNEKRRAFYNRHVGAVQHVLVERRNRKNGLLQGFSENYIPVQLHGSHNLIGTVTRVRITHIENDQPVAIPVED